MPASPAMPMNSQPPEYETFYDSHADEGERKYAMFNHLVGMVNVLDQGLLSAVATGVMWQVRKHDSPFLNDHGREALNFQFSLLLYTVILVLLTVVTLGLGFIVTGPGLIGLKILCLFGTIKGGVAAHRGEFYRYPMSIRFLA